MIRTRYIVYLVYFIVILFLIITFCNVNPIDMSVNSKDKAISLANEYLIKEGHDLEILNTSYNIIAYDTGSEWRVSYIKKDWINAMIINEKGELVPTKIAGGELVISIDKKNSNKIRRIIAK